MVTAHILIKGCVQGIGFRRFAQDLAEELELSGKVQNQSDGDVAVTAVGEREVIERLIERLRQGNGFSIIEKIDVKWKEGGKPLGEFKIARTSWW